MADEISEYQKQIAQRRAEAEKKAKEYLAKKVRFKQFVFTGEGIDEHAGTELVYYADYSQEEVNHLIQLFIDIYNTEFKKDKEAKTLDDIDIDLYSFKGRNPEIDELLDDCSSHNIYLEHIDPTPRYLYSMSCYFWNPQDESISSRYPFEVDLKDEQYIYLLTKQLESYNGGPSFTFDSLHKERFDISFKINVEATSCIAEDIYFHNVPYLIIFDEVIRDAKAIMESEK